MSAFFRILLEVKNEEDRQDNLTTATTIAVDELKNRHNRRPMFWIIYKVNGDEIRHMPVYYRSRKLRGLD